MARTQKQKPLTKKQEAFIEAMADPTVKSQTEAAKRVGYSPKTARVIASQNLTKLNIYQPILERKKRALAHYEVTREEVIGSAVFQMRSSIADVIDKNGVLDLEKAFENGAIDLVKEMEVDVNVDSHTGDKEYTYKIKMLTNQDGRKEVANYIKVENLPNTPEALTDEQLARELLRRMVENYGWTKEKTVKLIEERFPDVKID